METFLLVVLVVLVAILLSKIGNLKSDFTKRFIDLRTKISNLEHELEKWRNQPPPRSKPIDDYFAPKPAASIVPKQAPVVAPAPIPEEKREEIPQPTPIPAPVVPPATIIPAEPVPAAAPRTPPHVPLRTPTESWSEKWLRNNPDLEKFIGENLANKIGIGVLVLGIAFFVKYAIDQDWIKEQGRVAIGLLCGGLLVGLAHYLRKGYRSFSSVLVGGGIAIFYFTIAFAFHAYGFFGPVAAFVIMVVITIFAIVLALLYDRLELAVIAVIGGFITPFLVSTGDNNYVALFSYLSILNIGLLVLAYFKRWPLINIIALFFTIVIYGGWLVSTSWDSDIYPFPYRNALLFGTLFYLLFVAMNTLNNLREKRKFTAFDFGILLGINCLYYSAGIIILLHWDNGMYKGLFTAALGVFNLGMAWFLFRNQRVDRNFLYLLIGLTLTYISLAAPVQLEGNNITLFWAAETVLLFWLFQRSKIELFKLASLLIMGCMLISLLMDWQNAYIRNDSIVNIILNKGFVTSIVAALSPFLYYRLMRKETEKDFLPNIPHKILGNGMFLLSMILLYAAGALEIYYQFSHRLPGTGIEQVYLQLYTFVYAAVLYATIKKYSNTILYFRLFLLAICFILYFIDISIINTISTDLLTGHGNKSIWSLIGFHALFLLD